MEANPSLMELLEGVHDPRGARGKRHPLPALLALAVVALLAGMTSYEAFVDYGKERGGGFLRLLGFTRRRGLCKATYSRVFRRSTSRTSRRVSVSGFKDSSVRRMPRTSPATARPHVAVVMARRPGFTWSPLMPRMSKPSWPNSGWMPRPTNTRPQWSCWGCCR